MDRAETGAHIESEENGTSSPHIPISGLSGEDSRRICADDIVNDVVSLTISSAQENFPNDTNFERIHLNLGYNASPQSYYPEKEL